METFQMNLTVRDRLSIIELLPIRGNKLSIITVYDLIQKLALTEAEKKYYGIVTHPNGYIEWNKDASDKTQSFSFSESELLIIQDVIEEHNKKNDLSTNLVPFLRKLNDLK